MVTVYFRPLVETTPIDDTGFTTLNQFGVPSDTEDNYVNSLYDQFAAAKSLGQPVTRVRVSSAIANAIQGREFTTLTPGDVAQFGTCGQDRQNMQLWEDAGLDPDVAYVE